MFHRMTAALYIMYMYLFFLWQLLELVLQVVTLYYLSLIHI